MNLNWIHARRISYAVIKNSIISVWNCEECPVLFNSWIIATWETKRDEDWELVEKKKSLLPISPNEQSKIKKNWKDFCDIYNFRSKPLYAITPFFKLKDWLKFKQFLTRGSEDSTVYMPSCVVSTYSASDRWVNKDDRLLLDL